MDESKPELQNVSPTMTGGAVRVSPSSAATRHRDTSWNRYIARIAEGDHAALGSLYDESSGLVYSLALRILGDPADAEETTLDVYLQVWRSASAFDPTRGSAATWLVTLARSRAIDHIRSGASRKKREEVLESFHDLASSEIRPDQATAMDQERQLIRTALEELAPEQKEVIELAFFGGLTHSELAERLGQPLGTVKTRIRLGMMKLRTLLAPLGMN